MPPKFTFTKGCPRRRLFSCKASAISSLPVPLSPSINTEASVAATWPTCRSTASSWASSPMISLRANCWSRTRRPGGRAAASGACSCKMVPMVWSSASFCQGLVTNSAAPAFMPATASAMLPQPVSSTTGTAGASFLSSVNNASPSAPVVEAEKFMSSKTSWGMASRTTPRASAGPAAAAVA
jgi:hypothetical protein